MRSYSCRQRNCAASNCCRRAASCASSWARSSRRSSCAFPTLTEAATRETIAVELDAADEALAAESLYGVQNDRWSARLKPLDRDAHRLRRNTDRAERRSSERSGSPRSLTRKIWPSLNAHIPAPPTPRSERFRPKAESSHPSLDLHQRRPLSPRVTRHWKTGCGPSSPSGVTVQKSVDPDQWRGAQHAI